MTYDIKIKKSPVRFGFFAFISLFLAFLMLILVIGLQLGTVENTLNDFWYFFLSALAMGFFAFLTANRSYGSLRVKGSILTERQGFWGSLQTIDLADVKHLEAKVGNRTIGVRYTGGGALREQSLDLILTAANGATFVLSPSAYGRHDRAKLEPVLRDLQHSLAVTKEGDIDQALAVWFNPSPQPGGASTAAESQLTSAGTPRALQIKAFKRWLIAVVVMVIVIFGAIAIAGANYTAMCVSLAKNHSNAAAQVTRLQLLQAQKGRYRFDKTVSDPAVATQLVIGLQYTVNGQAKKRTMYVNNHNQALFTSIYEEAATGSLDVVYNPSRPSQVRPALEFPDDSPTLCEQ